LLVRTRIQTCITLVRVARTAAYRPREPCQRQHFAESGSVEKGHGERRACRSAIVL